MAYLRCDSIILTATLEDDDSVEVFIPKGAHLPITDKWVSNMDREGRAATLYWVKFAGDARRWVVGPEWWQATELPALPDTPAVQPGTTQTRLDKYRLVKVED